MTKRTGHVYEQMALWENIVEAENVSTKRKMKNYGVKKHIAERIRNLAEIQRMVLEGRMRTSEYKHECRISGQDKLRKISKLHFHPSHIEHQLLVMAGERRMERNFIRHTYASRKGYGQIACALRIRKNLRKYRGEEIWYGQGDVIKYYANTSHTLVRECLERLFKDSRFIDAFMEPFGRFSGSGVGIPLGIRPSQSVGNLTLSSFDHFMTEEVKARDYIRYLDDFVFLGETKGEVKAKMKRAKAYLSRIGFEIHEPKIRRVNEGLDMMGFVFYGYRSDMWWRKANKRRWLKRRSKVTNPKRLRELDDAAWGMLKWGNGNCRRLWKEKAGRMASKEDMGVNFRKSGIQRKERLDANGNPFIDFPKIGMQMILGKPVEVERWIGGIKTAQGDGRYALQIKFMGERYKLIINASGIKSLLEDMTANSVTLFKTVFIDRGGLRYDVDDENTEILEVNGRIVEVNANGEAVYADGNKEKCFTN